MRCIKKSAVNMAQFLRCMREKGWDNNRKTFVYVFIRNILQVMSNVVSIVCTKELIDSISSGVVLIRVIICFCGIILSIISEQLFSNILLHTISNRETIIRKEMEIAVDLHTAKMPYAYIESLEGQEDLERARIGLDLAGGIYENVNLLVECVIKMVITAVWIIYIGKVSFIFVFVIFFVNVMKNYIRKKEIMNDKNLEMKQGLINRQYRYFFREMFSHDAGKIIRIYNADQFIAGEADRILTKIFGIMRSICNMTIVNNIIIQILSVASLCVVTIYGYSWTIANDASVGTYSLFVSVYLKIIDYCVKAIDNTIQFAENAKAYMEYDYYMKKEGEDTTGISIQRVDSIEFRNVTFSYPYGEREVLKNISFKVETNQRVAIVGKNGSGKTTIIKLLMGLYKPMRGEIRINNHSLNDLDLQNYRNCIGFVDQHFRVFEGRIRDNVTCGTVEDEKLLQSCLSRANITKKINELPNKEDTYVGRYLREEGINLSGGERQKISIARGLYKEGKILVLDEPTSAMDVFSRDYFEQKFLNHVDESILLYVTHNLRSIRKCDYIIVIENGEIVEIGKTKELFSNKNSIICQMMKSEYHFEKEKSSEVKSKIRRMTC